jgi:hypothetical protein
MKRLRRRLVFYGALAAVAVLIYLNRPLDASLGNLENADRYELFSLRPCRTEPEDAPGLGQFHKYTILAARC